MSLVRCNLVTAAVFVLFFFQPGSFARCQDTDRLHTIFTNDARFGYLWSAGIKLNSVFNKMTNSVDLYGGLLINNKILIGAAGGINVGYPKIFYGYMGMIGQYIYKPDNFIHYSWQTTLCYGSLRVNDNSINRFYFIEPGFNVRLIS